ncbi:MAG TPA: endonuclease/exonuclease/phosphatase family protein [Microbacterium sp.]|nr:endonuclease/exonuclease/phosphatase family protein [Microbacterium sp.]
MDQVEVEDGTPRLRVVTFNVLDRAHADGESREKVVKAGLAAADADVVALQEVMRSDAVDQVRDWFGPDVTAIDHPQGSPGEVGACLVSRHPVGAVHVLDLRTEFGATGLPWAGAVAAEILAPEPIGTVMVVHHKPSWQLDREHLRERQAVAVARFVEDLASDRADLPVVLMGDFDAGPDTASMQFLTGRRSLDAMSVRYDDAWEMRHPDDPGHTFTPINPLVRAGQMPLERGRRIDHILIRAGEHGPLLDVAECRRLFDRPDGGVWASDHFGVLADLRMPPHPPGTWARPRAD